MNDKELREIRRRFRPDKNNISRLYGCFVNSSGNIISRISQPMAFSDTASSEKLLAVLKRVLSGSIGTSLINLSYTTHQVGDGAKHKRLMKLLSDRLGDTDTLEEYYGEVIKSVKFEGNYVILIACDTYDVPAFGKDGVEEDSTESFSYIISAVCQIKSLPEALTFKEGDSLFHIMSEPTVLGTPEVGFMFPAFDDRRTNIYGALYYSKNPKDNIPAFAKNLLDAEIPMPPKAQKDSFSECLSSSLCEDCTLGLLRKVHAEIEELREEHKSSRDPEPFELTRGQIKGILEGAGVGEEKIEALGAAFDKSFGKNSTFAPKNVISTGKLNLSMPEVSIKVSPEYRDIVTTKTVGDEKYIMIKVTGPVEVNGVVINTDEKTNPKEDNEC